MAFRFGVEAGRPLISWYFGWLQALRTVLLQQGVDHARIHVAGGIDADVVADDQQDVGALRPARRLRGRAAAKHGRERDARRAPFTYERDHLHSPLTRRATDTPSVTCQITNLLIGADAVPAGSARCPESAAPRPAARRRRLGASAGFFSASACTSAYWGCPARDGWPPRTTAPTPACRCAHTEARACGVRRPIRDTPPPRHAAGSRLASSRPVAR